MIWSRIIIASGGTVGYGVPVGGAGGGEGGHGPHILPLHTHTAGSAGGRSEQKCTLRLYSMQTATACEPEGGGNLPMYRFGL